MNVDWLLGLLVGAVLATAAWAMLWRGKGALADAAQYTLEDVTRGYKNGAEDAFDALLSELLTGDVVAGRSLSATDVARRVQAARSAVGRLVDDYALGVAGSDG